MATGERDSRLAADYPSMCGEQGKTPEIRLPDDEDDVLEMAGAETDKDKSFAIAQARRIGDLPDE